MNDAVWLPNGNILAPVAVEEKVGDEVVIGDGRAEIAKGSELWKQWVPWTVGSPPPDVVAWLGVEATHNKPTGV